METLITLIIVVVAALLSKKKKDRGAALPEEKTTLPSSPWDDLIREIQSGRSDASPKGGEAASGGDRGEYAAEVPAEPATEAAAPAPLSLCARLWGRFCRAAGVLFSGCSHICKIHVVEWGQPNKIGSECLEKAMDGAGLYPVSVCQPDPARGSRGRVYRCARRGVV